MFSMDKSWAKVETEMELQIEEIDFKKWVGFRATCWL